ncbi:MAG: YpdA family putative bacillithiol disulfide reductase [Gemmatimonadaceae bacterium]
MTGDAVDVVIVGAGPCGVAAAIALDRAGFRTLVFEAGCVVNAITQYPINATFFSTAERLSLGGLPFIVSDPKPSRRDALAYYRAVVRHFGIQVRQYERVTAIDGEVPRFVVHSDRRGMRRETPARAVVIATGYWGSPNLLRVPGEDLSHVSHTYREGHHAFQQKVVVVGGGNSAAEAALDLWRCGADVTLTHFGPTFDKKIKPWILPDLTNRIAEGSIHICWNARVTAIDGSAVHVHVDGDERLLEADHVYLLTGFSPNVDLVRSVGVPIDAATGIPSHDPATLETTVAGVFIAGVVIAGYDANKVFIENGRYHGDKIVARLVGSTPPETPGVSRDLDGG